MYTNEEIYRSNPRVLHFLAAMSTFCIQLFHIIYMVAAAFPAEKLIETIKLTVWFGFQEKLYRRKKKFSKILLL
jgi:hypothetical protein